MILYIFQSMQSLLHNINLRGTSITSFHNHYTCTTQNATVVSSKSGQVGSFPSFHKKKIVNWKVPLPTGSYASTIVELQGTAFLIAIH